MSKIKKKNQKIPSSIENYLGKYEICQQNNNDGFSVSISLVVTL